MAHAPTPSTEPRDAAPRVAGAAGRCRWILVTGLAVVTLIGFAGCGSETSDEAAAGDSLAATAEPAAPADAGDAIVRVVRARTDRPRRTTFPHDPHRAIACPTCHASVASHVTHGQVRCTECHRVPEHFDSLRVLSPAECLECHHTERAGVTCGECHRPAVLAGEYAVRAAVEITAAQRTTQETLPFDHQWHAGVDCSTCHAPSVLHEFAKECRSCHDEHHRPEARCASCHPSVDRPVHAEAAHNGCGGTGCHVDRGIDDLPPVRSVCLACHGDKEDHEPGRECAECHAIPDSWPRR